MTAGGKREGSGRKKGVPTRAQQTLADILANRGCKPLEILADIACGKKMRAMVGLNKEIGDIIVQDVEPTLDQRLAAAKELSQYVHPKLRAVEHSGPGGGPIETKDVTKTDKEIIAQYNNQKGNK